MMKSIGTGGRYSSSLMKLFLRSCLHYLKYAASKEQAVSIALPFRCLEVMLLEDRNENDEERWTRFELLDSLLGHGTFSFILALVLVKNF